MAYLWGQVMVQLKRYVESGVAAPALSVQHETR